MAFMNKLFGNKKAPTLTELDQALLNEHSQAWAKVKFSAEALAFSSEAFEIMRNYVYNDTISLQTRKETIKKVILILNNLSNTTALTREPADAETAELLRYAVIGWTSTETNAMLQSLNNVIQALLQNTSSKMSTEERKMLMIALLGCRNACAMRLSDGAYNEADANEIQGIIQAVQIELRNNIEVSRVLDKIQALKDRLSDTTFDVSYPSFTSYAEFCNTSGAAIEAVRNLLSVAENKLSEIKADMAKIRDLYRTLAENDSRRGDLQRDYDALKTKESAFNARTTLLSDRLQLLIKLKEAIDYVNLNVDLAKHPDFTKLFKNTGYRELLNREKYDAIMTTLDAIKKSIGTTSAGKINIYDYEQPKHSVAKKSALDEDILAEDQKNTTAPSHQLDDHSFTLK